MKDHIPTMLCCIALAVNLYYIKKDLRGESEPSDVARSGCVTLVAVVVSLLHNFM